MKNYIMLNGKQIELSDETAAEMSKQLTKQTWAEKVIAKYPKIGDPTMPNTTHPLEVVADRIIRIPLPSANTGWTFAVFDLTKKICEEFNAYPIHFTDNDNSNFLYIKMSY